MIAKIEPKMFILVGSVVLAHLWSITPGVQAYALQAFAASFFLYFIIKKAIRPKNQTVALSLLTFSFLLIITATGYGLSPFFPLLYALLFLLVFNEDSTAAIVTTLAIVIHFVLIDQSLTLSTSSTYTSLPFLLFFFIYAKQQYDQLLTDKEIISIEKEAVHNSTENLHSLVSFTDTFLKPHLQIIRKNLNDEDQNYPLIQSQLSLLEIEIDKINKKHLDTQKHIEKKREILNKEYIR